MKRVLLFLAFGILTGIICSQQSHAADKMYRIETLQVTKIEPFDKAYKGFVDELARNGLVEGKNLTINRRFIDFDIEKGGLWKKIGVLMSIKSQASSIVAAKPDLVLTIGTPATKYAKDKIIAAGIPLVFTAVAEPKAAGCASITEAGKGFTGATLWMDMKDVLKLVKLGFPNVKTIGVVHSDDENAIAEVADLAKASSSFEMKIIDKEVNKAASSIPAMEALKDQGAQAFIVPLDAYFGLRDYEACRELGQFSRKTKIPGISLTLIKEPGAVLYIGCDFQNVGSYAAKQTVKILREGVNPSTLPIMRQEELKILVDVKQMKALGMQLPMGILMLAKPVE